MNDWFLVAFSFLAIVGAIEVGRIALWALTVTLYAVGFVVAGAEHPECLDRLADAMEPR